VSDINDVIRKAIARHQEVMESHILSLVAEALTTGMCPAIMVVEQQGELQIANLATLSVALAAARFPVVCLGTWQHAGRHWVIVADQRLEWSSVE
jgi:superoxide dismutase